MRLVTRRTGLSSHLIRAWERRYGAVVPHRSDTNRRLYSEEDVQRLCLLRDAAKAGHSIGQIAQLPAPDLRRLLPVFPALESPPEFSDQPIKNPLEDALLAIELFDRERLEQILNRASLTLTQPALMDDLLVPLLHELGRRWESGEFRISQEHMASALVRSVLGRLNESLVFEETAPAIVFTTPSGQQHELGALMATLTAAAAGWRAIYLGPNLPASEIVSAVAATQAIAVGLSIVYPPDDPRLAGELQILNRHLPEATTIFAGGSSSESYGEILSRTSASHIESLSAFRKALRETRKIQSQQG